MVKMDLFFLSFHKGIFKTLAVLILVIMILQLLTAFPYSPIWLQRYWTLSLVTCIGLFWVS